MDRLNDIITNVLASLQAIANALLSLVFQPLFYLIGLIEAIKGIWTEDDDETPNENPNVTTYPSTNEGRYAEEVDLPACNEEHHIGYRINQQEQEELDKIKKQLNHGEQ